MSESARRIDGYCERVARQTTLLPSLYAGQNVEADASGGAAGVCAGDVD